MGDSSKDVQKSSKFQALKSEFKKIMWPDKPAITRKSIAVILTTAALSIVIALVDYIVKFGLDKLLG